MSSLIHALYPSWPKKKSTGVPVDIPFDAPGFLLNGLSARAFNFFYHHKSSGDKATRIVDYDTFFFPLDMFHNWNRIYGRRGFLQYQFVLPVKESRDGLEAVLREIANGGHAPFLTVLKLLGGREGEGVIPFPMEGYTLALDFPLREGIFPFLDKLDGIVLSRGGKHYLTKDARMGKATFEAGYPRDNILFQTPRRALLYQNDTLAIDADLTRPQALIDTLELLFSYTAPAYDQWERAVS